VSLGDAQRALVETARDAQGWRFARASVELSGGTPVLTEARGLAAHGHVAALDVERWLAFDTTGGSGDPLLSYADLQVDDLVAFDQHFAHVRAQVDRNDREWLVQLDGNDLRGSMFVPLDPHGDRPLIAKLDALHLAATESSGTTADPRTLRPLQAEVGDFSYGTMKFGKLTLELARVANGVRVRKFETAAPSFTISGSGQWLLTDFGHQSQLDFKLHSTDVAPTLAALDFESSLNAADADMTASVSWPGPPGPRFKEQLTGDVKLHVGKGQLESVDPGAGRMFAAQRCRAAAASVAGFPRRVREGPRRRDPRRLLADGGNATHEQSRAEGPAADVGITGARTRDQRLRSEAIVYANFGASLPVAGALAAGPAVGAALLIFSEIFKKPLKTMSGMHYRITGTWEEPLVERITGGENENAEGARNAGVQPNGQPVAGDHR
jgi:uncharacterized protein YhdP